MLLEGGVHSVAYLLTLVENYQRVARKQIKHGTGRAQQRHNEGHARERHAERELFAQIAFNSLRSFVGFDVLTALYLRRNCFFDIGNVLRSESRVSRRDYRYLVNLFKPLAADGVVGADFFRRIAEEVYAYGVFRIDGKNI